MVHARWPQVNELGTLLEGNWGFERWKFENWKPTELAPRKTDRACCGLSKATATRCTRRNDMVFTVYQIQNDLSGS